MYSNFTNNQIMTLKAKILSVENFSKGEYLGYGDGCFLSEDKRVIIVAFGYSYGYDFLLSYVRTYAFYKGKKIQLLGTVGMNHICFDITNINDSIEIGDYIVLIAPEYPETNMADLSQLLNKREYVFSTCLSRHIKKVII